MINLFDIACNFSSNRFDNDLNEVIQRAKNNNVTKFLVVSASLKDAEKVHRIYQDNKDSCFFTIGVHPHHANEFDYNDAGLGSTSLCAKSIVSMPCHCLTLPVVCTINL